jgi:hypothetical protein
MPPTARDTFVRNIRPAQFFLYLHELLEDQGRPTPQELVDRVSAHLRVAQGEALKLIRNAAFLGFICPGSGGTIIDLNDDERANLLRQAVVVCCSATETFLTDLLVDTLPDVIKVCGIGFLDASDDWLLTNLSELVVSFKTKDVLARLAQSSEDRATWLGSLIVSQVRKTYIKGDRGLRLVGRLLGLADPWGQIEACHADLEDPAGLFDEVVRRRKEIVHRGDFSRATAGLADIDRATVQEWVSVTRKVCLCLDRLTSERLEQLREALKAGLAEER